MRAEIGEFFHEESARRWVEYFIKAAVLFLAFFIIAQLTPSMPPVCLAIVWATLSIVASIRPMYHFIIKKVYRQHGLKPGGILSNINGGRTLSTIIAFVVSALCVAGLLIEAPKWGLAEWLVSIAAIPLYPLVFLLAEKVVKTSVESPYQLSQTIRISCIAVGVILCFAYLLICSLEPSTAYETYAQATSGIKQPFEGSPTSLLVIAGDYNHIAESLTVYGISKASLVSSMLGIVLRVLICVAAFFAIARLLGACILKPKEMKLAFLPLEAAKKGDSNYPPMKRYVVLACFLPLLLIVGFLVAESRAEEVIKTEEYEVTKTFVHDQAEAAASLVDGEYLVSNVVLKNLALTAGQEVAELAEKRDEELVSLVNAMYDKRIENVGAYLDWYYSPLGEADRIAHFFAGNEGQERFYELINEGVDDEGFKERCEYYVGEFNKIVKKFQTEIHKLKLPEDLAMKYEDARVQLVSSEELIKSLEPNQSFLEEGERLSAGVGFGPETGRFVGFFDGFIFLPIDQLINRESYREAIIAAIEEDRAKMIDKVKTSNRNIEDFLSEFLDE